MPVGPARASWVLSSGVGVVSFVVYVLRSLPLANKLWAEDASVYLTNAYNDPVHGIFKPYNGYLDLAPGILELPLRLVAPGNAPLAIIAITGVVFGLVAGLTTRVSSLYLQSVAFASALGLATVLVPILAQEAIAELGALQFILVYALFWLALLPASRGLAVWAPAGVALLIGLTSPLALAALPLALLLAWRSPPKRPLAVALALGGVVEGTIHLLGAGGQRYSTRSSAAGAGLRGIERLFASIAPNQLTETTVSRAAGSLVVLVLVVVTFGGLVDRLEKPRPALALGLLALWSGVWFELFASVLNRGSTDRYLVPSSLLLIAALIAAADEVTAAPRRSTLAFLSCSTAGIILIASMGAGWRPGSWRSSSYAWDAQVTQARSQCTSSPRLAVVRIPAGGFSWAVARVPCSRL